ncbi:MAG: SLBB domain-containing protein [Ignavibacteriaceae bacterium]|nr:SLBB domain-containing protein [Ignavibacteriaceae bacterium]
MRHILITTFLALGFLISIFPQQEDYQLGLNQNRLNQSQGAYYDYSDPDGLNIKVSVWGYVKYPGRYIIPQRSDIKDLISYSGGISDDSYLDEIRVYKVLPDSTQQMLQFDYEDLWWNEDLKQDLSLYRMEAGDVLVVPGRPRLYWENYLTLGLSIVGVLLSLTTLIVTSNK